MKLNRGIIHEYLGMALDYSTRGELKITMYNYIRDIVTDFNQYDPSNNKACTPDANHLFKVQDDQNKISETLAQVFHTFTAQDLFATKRAGLTSTQQSHFSRPEYLVPMMMIGPSWYV